MENPSLIQILASVIFGIAVIHTFFAVKVELVMAGWGAIFLAVFLVLGGAGATLDYLKTQSFFEPVFVFAIMAVCGSRPVLALAEKFIHEIASILPLPKKYSFYFTALTVGPLLGSFITEPAAMTVTAYILKEKYFRAGVSERFKYFTLGLLFVNISIGGVLTPYAAPPVLMVAKKWNWDLAFMLTHFGWKAMLAIFINTSMTIFILLKDFDLISKDASAKKQQRHFIDFKEPFLVGLFLAGIVVLGGMQKWWLAPLMSSLSEPQMYIGATLLTAVTDNAALTYLGSQLDGMGEAMKYLLVAGAVTGGGLTVIANAPNPAGYGILNETFGEKGIRDSRLFLAALGPTAVAFVLFWMLP